MRKRVDLPRRRDITSIVSEGKNKGWTQVQVGLQVQVAGSEIIPTQGLLFPLWNESKNMLLVRDEMGTQGFEKKVWNGNFRNWRVNEQEDSEILQGWMWFESQWRWWQGRLLSWGVFCRYALLPKRREESILLSFSRNVFSPRPVWWKNKIDQ